MKGFWKKLKKPILALAPMSDVTDSCFRQIICKYGKPDCCFTEFVSVDGLCSAGKDHLVKDLFFKEKERPIVAQIFGASPPNFFKVAKMLKKMKFDGIDINMGCPEKSIQRQGSGASLIKNPELAKEIIIATKEGAGRLPVSVKTRIGYSKNVIEEWMPVLASASPALITVHGRTKKEMSKVPANWDSIKRSVEIVKSINKNILVLGNGDVKNLEDAYEKTEKYSLDGVMVGRGIFGNPWFFNKKIQKKDLSLSEILKVMLEHAFLFEKMYKGQKKFLLMRKHFSSYISGFDGAKKLRNSLMQVDSAEEVEETILNYKF